MTKPVTRKLAVDCLCWLVQQPGGTILVKTDEVNNSFTPYFKCYICGEQLLPGQKIQFDHVHADVHEGPHEYQNLRPVHYDPCHKNKTAKDIKANAKVKRLRGETKGRPKRVWASRKMQSRLFTAAGSAIHRKS